MNYKPENRIPSLFPDLENVRFSLTVATPKYLVSGGSGGVASIKRIAFIGMNIHGLLDYDLQLLGNA